MRAGAYALLLLAAFTSAGCQALWTDVAYDAGQPKMRLAHLPDRGEPKADVLFRLGPPGEMIAQPDGDIWVYRLRIVGNRIINVHTGFVAPVAVPVYMDADGSSFDRTVFIFFSPAGDVSRVAHTEVS